MMRAQKEKKVLDPATQVLLDLRRGGKRFQLICNRDAMNKFRQANKGKKPADIKVSSAEIDEILTDKTIFTNVAKADIAKKEDVAAAFEKMSETEVLQTMLARGEVQLNESDRQKEVHETHDLINSAVAIVVKKVFNPTPAKEEGGKTTKSRTYTVEEIDREVKNIKFTCKPNRTPESVALSIIKALKVTDTLPIQRQQIKFKADLEEKKNSSLLEKIQQSKGHALIVGTPAPDAKVIEFILDAELMKEWKGKFDLGQVSKDAFAAPANAEEDLTYAEDEEGAKEGGGKAGGKKGAKPKGKEGGAAAAAAGGDSDEDEKGKGKKGKGKAKKEQKALKAEEDEGAELAKDEEAAPAKPAAKKAAAKGKKGKGGDDSDDDAPRGGRRGRGGKGDLEAELGALVGKKGGSDDDSDEGAGGSNPFAQLAGKKKKKGGK